MKSEKREKPAYSVRQNVWYMIKAAWKEERGILMLCIVPEVLAILASITELFIAPSILQKVETKAALSELLWTITGFTFALVFLQGLRSYISARWLLGDVSLRMNFVSKMTEKRMTTSYPNIEDPQVEKLAELASRCLEDEKGAFNSLLKRFAALLKNIAGFVIYMVLLSNLHPLLAVVVMTTSVAGYLVSVRYQEWGYQNREELAEYEKKLEYIANKGKDSTLAKDIRVFGMGKWLEKVYDRALDAYRRFYKRMEGICFKGDVFEQGFSLLRNAAAYLLLIWLTLEKDLSASAFLLYFTAISGFAAWVNGIFKDMASLRRNSLEICNLRVYLEKPELFRFADGETLSGELLDRCEIRFENVSFRYPGTKKDTLHNINLTIQPGEKLAVVGLNGAGKTTLVKLLCGFYDPTEGRVLLNGVDIRKYDRKEYYRLFSAVFQQFSILEGTLAENISQSLEAQDEKKIWDCLQKAGIRERVERMPQKLETHIGRMVYDDGIELSGGETQRLMLARALYKNGRMIVLDEPTAALDPLAEADMYERYHELTMGKTSVYISHRLASTRFCDRILYLEDGGIAEEGTHDQLLQKNGKYAELFRLQGHYYQEGVEF